MKFDDTSASDESNALESCGAVTNVQLRYDTRCYFNVRSKADISQLNLPHRESKKQDTKLSP